jgi:hypothetical protein
VKDAKELVEALRLWAKDTEWVYSPQGADEMKQAADRIEALEAEVARLREALAFYAQPMAYQPTGWIGGRDPSQADQDRGKRARAALTPPAPSPEPGPQSP